MGKFAERVNVVIEHMGSVIDELVKLEPNIGLTASQCARLMAHFRRDLQSAEMDEPIYSELHRKARDFPNPVMNHVDDEISVLHFNGEETQFEPIELRDDETD
jgi:hypothetical protein